MFVVFVCVLGFGLIIIDFLLFQFSLDPIHGLVLCKEKQQGANKKRH
jgi:hypothetical protein